MAEPEPPRTTVSPLDAVADMRATAKWILAAAAAVGAALLGGGPLTAVGKVHGLGADLRAYGGLAIALLGVGWAIWHTADALIPPLTTPRFVDEDPALRDLRARIAQDPGAFYGPYGNSMADLVAARADFLARQDRLTALRDTATRDPQRRAVDAALAELTEAITSIGERTRVLLELGHAWQVRGQLRKARLNALAGTAVAALGAVLFLSATSGH